MTIVTRAPVARVATEEVSWYDAHPTSRWHVVHREDGGTVLRVLAVLSPSGATLATFTLSEGALHCWALVAVWFERLLQASNEDTFTKIAQQPASGVDLVGFSARGAS